MHLPIRGRRRSEGQELVEIVTPRTNAATITPAENLLAAISLPEPFSLEIVGTPAGPCFLARAAGSAMRQHLESQLGVAYPQAELHHLDVERSPDLDPLRLRSEEQVRACTLVLRAPPYLPIRTFRDADVEAGSNAQADPVLGILGALGDLPEGWRGLSQLVLCPVPDHWCHGYLRLAVEHPLAPERAAVHSETSQAHIVALAAAIVAGVIAFQGYRWYRHDDGPPLALLAIGLLAAELPLFWIARRRMGRPAYDMRLVQEKVSRIAYRAQLRLAVIAPGSVPSNRQDRVVYLDAALGWDRDKAASNCLAIFERESGGFWDPRMEDSFRFALLMLYEANQKPRPRNSPGPMRPARWSGNPVRPSIRSPGSARARSSSSTRRRIRSARTRLPCSALPCSTSLPSALLSEWRSPPSSGLP